ncbi:MAG TPA: hypothetical protein VNO31_02305, partial [Umezawaea sp.]|nr:hypothetical protein [Umezawaea sp.]
LDPVEPGQRNARPPARPQPTIVDAVLALFPDDAVGHVATADLAEKLRRVPRDASDTQRQQVVAALAREISDATGLQAEQRRNADRYPDRTRGFLLEELRQYRTS